MLLQLALMSEDVGWKRYWWGEGSKVRAGRLHLAKIREQVFRFHRPMAPAGSPEFDASASRPTRTNFVYAGALVRRGKGVEEKCLIVEVGHRKPGRSIEEHRTGSHAKARTSSPQPVGADRLFYRQAGWSAARIRGAAYKVIVHMHCAEVGLKAQHEMFALKVVSHLAATGESSRTQLLLAGCGNRRDA